MKSSILILLLLVVRTYGLFWSRFKCSNLALKRVKRPIDSKSIDKIKPCITTADLAYLDRRDLEIYYFGEHLKKSTREQYEARNQLVPGMHIAFRYEILELLGQGTFGAVYKVNDHKDQVMYALKMALKNEQMLEWEFKAAQKIFGPEGQDAYGGREFILEPVRLIQHHARSGILYPLRQGTVADVVKKGGGVTYEGLQNLAFSMSAALATFDINGLVHCDLKPANILVYSKSDMRVKQLDRDTVFELADFGLAGFSGLQSNRGSPRYIPPENKVITVGSSNERTPKSDMYALGITLLDVISEKNNRFSTSALKSMTPDDIYSSLARLTRGRFSADQLSLLADFTVRCITVTSRRLTPKKALAHPFLHQFRVVPGSGSRQLKKLPSRVSEGDETQLGSSSKTLHSPLFTAQNQDDIDGLPEEEEEDDDDFIDLELDDAGDHHFMS